MRKCLGFSIKHRKEHPNRFSKIPNNVKLNRIQILKIVYGEKKNPASFSLTGTRHPPTTANDLCTTVPYNDLLPRGRVHPHTAGTAGGGGGAAHLCVARAKQGGTRPSGLLPCCAVSPDHVTLAYLFTLIFSRDNELIILLLLTLGLTCPQPLTTSPHYTTISRQTQLDSPALIKKRKKDT